MRISQKKPIINAGRHFGPSIKNNKDTITSYHGRQTSTANPATIDLTMYTGDKTKISKRKTDKPDSPNTLGSTIDTQRKYHQINENKRK